MAEPIDINRIQSIQAGQRTAASAGAPRVDGASFADVLRQSLDKVNELQAHADESIQKLATGETKNLADVMVAVENAGVAFQFTMQVRNKIVEAYQELMRMQI